MKLQFDNIICEGESVENSLNVLYDFVCILAGNDFNDDSVLDSLLYVEKKFFSMGINLHVILLNLRDLLRMSLHKD